jgi:hypothetical protein
MYIYKKGVFQNFSRFLIRDVLSREVSCRVGPYVAAPFMIIQSLGCLFIQLNFRLKRWHLVRNICTL